MRVRRTPTIFVTLLLCLGFLYLGAEDTGTYRILDYRVKLVPLSNGKVDMTYFQKWEVTGGHIPWITIGTANALFNLDYERVSGNIKEINVDFSGSWTGVRIDLDRDYRRGELFQVEFGLIQTRLLDADEENYKLEFTPGWYDRAKTDRLEIRVRIFAPMDAVRTEPAPTRIEGEEIIWIRNDLAEGERFTISVFIPKDYMPSVGEDTLKSRPVTTSDTEDILIIFIALIIIILIFIALKGISGGGYGRGGGISYGGRGRSRGSRGGGFRGRSSGGGGGFGGRSISCACACVSCACACACAGGGGAGCARKIDHDCPLCRMGTGGGE